MKRVAVIQVENPPKANIMTTQFYIRRQIAVIAFIADVFSDEGYQQYYSGIA